MTLVVQRIIGRAAIIDPIRGRVYASQHRAAYSFVQAQEVADWLNGSDRPLNIVARSVDPFDPVQRQSMRAGDYRCDIKGTPRKGLAPLPDKE